MERNNEAIGKYIGDPPIVCDKRDCERKGDYARCCLDHFSFCRMYDTTKPRN